MLGILGDSFLFAAATGLLFLGWGGAISILTTAGTLDPKNPAPNSWSQLEFISNYSLGIGISGIVVLIVAIRYFIVAGGALKKEAIEFNQ